MMKMMKIFACTLCVIFILGTTSSCNFAPLDDSDLISKNISEGAPFLEEKQELVKLPGVTEDKDGNILIPLKINEVIEITLPNGNIILYSLNSKKSETSDDNKIISVCKEYKYKFVDSFVTAEVIATTECDWANRSVTINRSYHDAWGKNPFGDIVISNKENTIIKKSGDTATAEAAGNIEFSFSMDSKNYSKLVAYRIQIIVNATNSQSAVIKVLS